MEIIIMHDPYEQTKYIYKLWLDISKWTKNKKKTSHRYRVLTRVTYPMWSSCPLFDINHNNNMCVGLVNRWVFWEFFVVTFVVGHVHVLVYGPKDIIPNVTYTLLSHDILICMITLPFVTLSYSLTFHVYLI